jgi:hypothetical protein
MVRAELKADTVGIVVVDDSKLGTLNRTYANNKATRCRAIVAIFCLLTDAPDITIPISHSDGARCLLFMLGLTARRLTQRSIP